MTHTDAAQTSPKRNMWSLMTNMAPMFLFDLVFNSGRALYNVENFIWSNFLTVLWHRSAHRCMKHSYFPFSRIQLLNMCFDLWLAGMETTSNTLSWGVVYLLNHHDVQVRNS